MVCVVRYLLERENETSSRTNDGEVSRRCSTKGKGETKRQSTAVSHKLCHESLDDSPQGDVLGWDQSSVQKYRFLDI